MANSLAVEELLPLVEALVPRERTRLLCLLGKLPSDEAAIYAMTPTVPGECNVNEDPLAWDSEGWENIT